MTDDELDPYEYPYEQLEGDLWPPKWLLVPMVLCFPVTFLAFWILSLWTRFDCWRYERWCEKELKKDDQ